MRPKERRPPDRPLRARFAGRLARATMHRCGAARRSRISWRARRRALACSQARQRQAERRAAQ
eukprot:458707-Prymnesium_polylepis.1